MGSRQQERDAVVSNQAVAVALLALGVGLGWAWWDSFHEFFRFFVVFDAATFGDMPPFVLGGEGYLHCLMESAGIVVGCAAVIVVARRGHLQDVSGNGAEVSSGPKLLAAAQVLLTLANGLVKYFAPSERMFQYAIYGLASVLFALFVVHAGLLLRKLDARRCGLVFVGALGTYALCNDAAFPLVLRNLPMVAVCLVYSLLPVLAYMGVRKAAAAADLTARPQGERRTSVPWQPVVHLLAYGFVFGLLHVLEGLIQSGPYSVNIGVLFGAVLAGSLFAAVFLGRNAGKELWAKMQSTVFPLVVIGFILVPLALGSDAVLALTEAGYFMYLGFLVLGCRSFMGRTDIDGRIIVAGTLLCYGIGEIVGLAAGSYIALSFAALSAGFTLLTAFVVLLLTAATFWVGNHEQIRKLWGLRRNLTPKRYNDLVLAARIRTLEEEHGLTPRESEMLRFVAQGKRAPEIRDELGVSMDTVRTHLKHLYAKLDVHSYSETVQMLEAVPVDEASLAEPE